MSNNPDTLLVANSGGTNISRVYIGSTNAVRMHEDLAHRILTRNTYSYTITVTRDENTGKIRLTRGSDQLLGPPAVHRAGQGRAHLLLDASDGDAPGRNASLARSDRSRFRIRRQIWQYGTIQNTDQNVRAVQRGLDRH